MEQKHYFSNGWVVSNIPEDVTANKSDKEIYNIIKNGIKVCLVTVKN